MLYGLDLLELPLLPFPLPFPFPLAVSFLAFEGVVGVVGVEGEFWGLLV